MRVSVRGLSLVGGLAGALVVAGLGASFEPHSWPATIMVLIPASVLLWLAVRRRPPSVTAPAPRDRRGLVLWSVLVLAGLAWEVVAFVRQPDWSRADPVHPTFSTLLDPVLEHGPLRVVGWLVWLAAGVRLLARRQRPRQ